MTAVISSGIGKLRIASSVVCVGRDYSLLRCCRQTQTRQIARTDQSAARVLVTSCSRRIPVCSMTSRFGERSKVMNTHKKVTGTVSRLATALLSIYPRKKSIDLNAEIPTILASLQRAEQKVEKRSSAPRIAIGFGGCIDVTVDAIELFEKAGIRPPVAPRHHDEIDSAQHLSESFAHFFEHGAAAERYVSDHALFRRLVNAARSLASHRTCMGGNAPRMANRFAMEGARVLYATRASDAFKGHLREGVDVVGDGVSCDDVHLVLEFKNGDRWGKFTSVRANRYIIHSDEYNPRVQSLESLSTLFDEYRSSLLVIGGLQLLDNVPFCPSERTTRFASMRHLLMKANDGGILTHLEFANFVEEALVVKLVDHVIPYADSFGMNEQELPNLLNFLRYGRITMLSDAYPRVAHVLDQMRALYRLLQARYGRVSRLHIHTIAFQAILTREDAPWWDTMSAVAHASLTAHRFVSDSNEIKVEASKLLLDESFSTTVDSERAKRVPLVPERPVSCWREDIVGDGQTVLICVAPNLVCTRVFQTGGAGDNISAAGLVSQI